MAVVVARGAILEGGAKTNRISNAQVGNGASTDVVDRGGNIGPVALLEITTTVGATPTCTYTVEGSVDGVNWFPIAYADSATPETVSVATFVVTTTTTVRKIIRPNTPARFLRVSYSANTNVTNTADLTTF